MLNRDFSESSQRDSEQGERIAFPLTIGFRIAIPEDQAGGVSNKKRSNNLLVTRPTKAKFPDYKSCHCGFNHRWARDAIARQ
jgi:hypothetical protein